MSIDTTSAQRIAGWLSATEQAVIFTGAGMSTESGIPDFRSPGGIWTKYRTVYFNEFMASEEARHEYWRQKCEGHRDFAVAQPNAGHRVAAAWERRKWVRGVITQNIDGLHQLAGSQHVLELHGTARAVACMDCGARFDVDPLVAEFLETDRVPPCRQCDGGRLKHATVSFGQTLPAEVLEQAMAWAQSAELMFAIGSSLVVTPAADLPRITKQCGGRLVIINRDATPLDDLADDVIHASIGETLTAINACLPQDE